MVENENYSKTPSSPPGADLLQEMMPKLGMEAAEPTGQYKNKTRARYFLPKLLVLVVVIALVVAAVFVMRLPVRFHDVEFEQAYDMARLQFRLDRLPLLESVTAELDGRGMNVSLLDAGVYELETDRNGELVITARTLTDQYTTITQTVDCIDEEPPHTADDQLHGKYLYIYLTDGDGEFDSGIDWSTLQVTRTEDGSTVKTKVDEQAGYVRFPLPDVSVRLYVEDHNGNPLSLRLDRPTSTAKD